MRLSLKPGMDTGIIFLSVFRNPPPPAQCFKGMQFSRGVPLVQITPLYPPAWYHILVHSVSSYLHFLEL